jgi:hypothetical protein
MTTCIQASSVTVHGCDATTDWVSNPGNCRLRIKNYNPLDFLGACPACVASVLPDWAGEFNQFCNLALSEKYSPGAGLSIGGKAMAPNPCVASNFGILAGFWVFQVACDNGGGGLVVWSGTGPAAAAGPIGIYTFAAGCLAGPATLEIEGYSL